MSKLVTVPFSDETYARIMLLKETTGAKTPTDVVAAAVKLYEFLLNEKKSGAQIISENGDVRYKINL